MPFETFWTVQCEGTCGRRLNGREASEGTPEMFTSRATAEQAAQEAGWWAELSYGTRSVRVLIGCQDCLPGLLADPPPLFLRGLVA